MKSGGSMVVEKGYIGIHHSFTTVLDMVSSTVSSIDLKGAASSGIKVDRRGVALGVVQASGLLCTGRTFS